MKPIDLNVHQTAELKKRSRFWLIPQILLPVLVVAVSIFLSNTLVATKPDVPQRPPREQVYIVDTEPVALAANRPMLQVFGTLAAARNVELRALVAGEVVSVMPDLVVGATVRKGDVLVQIDRFDYEGAVTEAEINLAEAEARLAENRARLVLEERSIARYAEQLDFAEKDLERARNLLKSGNITQRGLDERELVVSQRRQALDQRRNTIDIEKAKVEQQAVSLKRLEWKLSQARRNLANTKLVAPFDGIVTSENVEAGRLLNVNDLAVAMYEDDRLEARFVLSDRQYGELALDDAPVIGRDIEVVWHVGGEPVRFAAVIDRVGAEIAPERGGVEVYARIPQQQTRVGLRPGAFVEVTVPGRAFPASARLPETAVYNNDHVFAVVDGRLAKRPVTVEAWDNGTVIVSGELKDGEEVLTTRIAEVGEGLRVREPGTGKARAKPADDDVAAR
ncbi:efflux RND transporter periplasmic adaptor subunit [Rhodobium gokarnense]|uniref:RND family efflux transporter MFP subunit n=1 Tax=Rhodobium gokarnense TaxID=364296 RepID=A0ABT3H7R0_9HYPH|nr:efflux RND transporter periplasmic adaptor subunit [Rhodobium gokarnense]MCW2306423.1 RND family efflux transporter MFP subunit [Rhodobium gokarnense]